MKHSTKFYVIGQAKQEHAEQLYVQAQNESDPIKRAKLLDKATWLTQRSDSNTELGDHFEKIEGH